MGQNVNCKSLAFASCIGTGNCLVDAIGVACREKMHKLTGNPDDLFWVGETGWSSPMATTLPATNPSTADCPPWSAKGTFQSFYQNFLVWDLTFKKGGRGPDHVFYFTMRDSRAFGESEYFGLVETCEATDCKLQKGSSELSVVV